MHLDFKEVLGYLTYVLAHRWSSPTNIVFSSSLGTEGSLLLGVTKDCLRRTCYRGLRGVIVWVYYGGLRGVITEMPL